MLLGTRQTQIKINMQSDYTRIRVTKFRKTGGPGQVAQLVRALALVGQVVGSAPGRGTCKNQPMNE